LFHLQDASSTLDALSWVWRGDCTIKVGAGGRTRTDMSVTSLDFESSAYTNFATPARGSGHDSLRVQKRQLGAADGGILDCC
jgi:hypothetical protein